MEANNKQASKSTLQTLPGDDVRQIQWRYAGRYDLAMLVQSARSVARGPVARLVAQGGRNSHEWTPEKAELLSHFDASGITALFLDPKYGGYLEGPKNLASALVAFELSWVDAGAATCSLAGNLALSPIHERGTEEQREYYMSRCVPGKAGAEGPPWRGAFALTEPLPYVGVETSLLCGKVRIVEWEPSQQPVLQVEKRGRFITNIGFADFVTAAVDSDDPRLKGSCMVILEKNDPGLYDRGATTHKLVHQLSSTGDPVFNLRVPAHRIIGGYQVKDGIIIPNFNHSEIIEAVFRRTRVTVGLMTAAKLLSSVEPLIRYHRGRFRGGESGPPGSPRFDLGLQQKQDVLHRLVDIWATGEASASLGFAAARLFDELDPLERTKSMLFSQQQIVGPRAQLKAMNRIQEEALEFLRLSRLPEAGRDAARFQELQDSPLVRFALLDAVGNVICPACKLWNTGHGANMMREAVSLMGGYGVTEDCPGFLGHKWMDAQLEATYEGPEAVQRRQLSVTMTNELFLAQYKIWLEELREIAAARPGSGACALASAMDLWLWTLKYLQSSEDAHGNKLYHGNRQGVTFALADALCWLLASRCQILDCLELASQAPAQLAAGDSLEGLIQFMFDLCHVQAGRAVGEVGRICAELVHGYQQHPAWDESTRHACFQTQELDSLEGMIPGIACSAPTCSDVAKDENGTLPKAGPCARLPGREEFVRRRVRLESCLTGMRLAKDRAAEALTTVMIPEALDYPA